MALSQPHVRKDRRERYDLSRFAALRASPHVFNPAGGSPLVLPGNCRLAFRRTDASATAGIATMVYGAHSLPNPALAQNAYHRLGWFEKTRSVDMSGTGTWQIVVLDSWRRPFVIATMG